MAIKIGKDAKLYRNSGTYSSPAWNLVSNVRDLTLNLETGEADVTTRGNNGWRATVATLKDASVEFEMVWDTEDLNFIAIRNAFLSNQPLELLVLDGIVISFTNQGLRATCMITGFSRNEPLEEAITVNVSAKPTYADNPPTWYNVDP
jgi:hypothetical protein